MKYRTLVRIVGVVDINDNVYLRTVIPGWNPHRDVLIAAKGIPDGVLAFVESSPGPNECTMYAHAHADLQAAKASELNLSGPWELSKVEHGDITTDADGKITDYGVTVLDEAVIP